MTPLLTDLSTVSTDEIADRAAARFHEARRILTAWQEEDPLTQAKLSALLEAYTYGELPAPNLIRPLYEKLGPNDQQSFRDFLVWFKKREAPRPPGYTDRGDRITQLQNQIR